LVTVTGYLKNNRGRERGEIRKGKTLFQGYTLEGASDFIEERPRWPVQRQEG
jgi:hypothetical protein